MKIVVIHWQIVQDNNFMRDKFKGLNLTTDPKHLSLKLYGLFTALWFSSRSGLNGLQIIAFVSCFRIALSVAILIIKHCPHNGSMETGCWFISKRRSKVIADIFDNNGEGINRTSGRCQVQNVTWLWSMKYFDKMTIWIDASMMGIIFGVYSHTPRNFSSSRPTYYFGTCHMI